MFDVHMHIIPGVDDGASSLDMARKMLMFASEQGVRAIIATPHSSAFNKPERVLERYASLRDYISEKEIPVGLALGCEVLFTNDNTENNITRLQTGELPTLNGSRYVLTEFLPDASLSHVSNMFQKLHDVGYVPVVAHAERCKNAFGMLETALELHNLALIQINAYSLDEEDDQTIKDTARMLLKNQLVDFIGSDAHQMDHRAPMVAAGIRYIRNNCSAEYARAVLWDNAKRLLNLGVHPYLDGLLGLAVGDALGVPYEYCTLDEMRDDPCMSMVGMRAHRQPIGTWSDDTSMALCIADSLAAKHIDPDDVIKRFTAWKNRGQYTAAGTVFDIGITCRKGIDRYNMGIPLELCGDSTENGNGNGGLMRTFPVSLYACQNHSADLDTLLRPVHEYSALTHAHPISLICCGMYTMFIREWMNRTGDEDLETVISRAIKLGKKYYESLGNGFAEAIDRDGLFLTAHEIKEKTENELPSSGYVVNTWNIAVWSLLNTNTFRDCVLKAINLGGDTDTNAAVAGSLAGFVYGCEDIPAEYMESLLNKKLIKSIANRLDGSGTTGQERPIDSFTGEFAFLAMKARCVIELEGFEFHNVTSTWLAQGVAIENRSMFTTLNAHQARRMFNQLPHIANWDNQRIDALRKACEAKFKQNPTLEKQLLATGQRQIVYDTTGSHDNELGRCSCDLCKDLIAQNLYGKILMDIRQNRLSEDLIERSTCETQH